MKEWVLSIGTTVVITTIISIILPEGKIGNYIKGIFSILLILAIIKPIFAIGKIDYNIENVLSQNVVILQDDFISFTNDKKVQNFTEKCEKIIEEIGIEKAVVNIDYFVDENNQIIIKYVNVNLRNSVIILDKEHIDIIEDVKTAISDYLNLDFNKVIIYE